VEPADIVPSFFGAPGSWYRACF